MVQWLNDFGIAKLSISICYKDKARCWEEAGCQVATITILLVTSYKLLLARSTYCSVFCVLKLCSLGPSGQLSIKTFQLVNILTVNVREARSFKNNHVCMLWVNLVISATCAEMNYIYMYYDIRNLEYCPRFSSNLDASDPISNVYL